MRKITNEAINAFKANKTFNGNNTKVLVENGTTKMYLFSHLIAKKTAGIISITNAGYFTPTTKDRLNSIPGVSISQKKGIWYLNGSEWHGEWIIINN